MWLALFLACGGPTEAPTPAEPARPALPEGVTPELYDRMCAQPCSGRGAVTAWHDDAGALALIVYQGDLARCSHVTKVWHDARGEVLLSLDDRPATPEEADANRAKIAEIQEGKRESRVVDCPGA